jgi:hypothetical protein
MVAKLGENASLIDHSSYFDSMLFEQLKFPGINILSYLEESWNRAENALDKTWNSNKEAQSFIKYSI